jgi:DNA polymerase III sliding clamp (beta) subunit (PCNA family)
VSPDLNDLVEMEHDDPEMVPEIVPASARFSVRAPVSKLRVLFSRCNDVAISSADKEVLPGTSSLLLEAVPSAKGALPYLRATASDGDTTVSVVSDGVVISRHGSVLLPAHRVHEILKLAPGTTAQIVVEGTTATIRSDRALWTIQVPATSEVSAFLDTSKVQTAPVPIQAFTEALMAARRAASATTARESLMQIQLRNGAFTGADGGRVHRALAEGVSPELTVTLPVRAVDEILKAGRASDTTYAEFGYDDSHVVFECDSGRIVAQRMQVDFPASIESLLMGPAFTNTQILQVRRRDLIDTIKRVRVNANPDSAAVTLSLAPAHMGALDLVVSARDQAHNSSQETLECVWQGSEKNYPSITLNHNYLIDFLEVQHGDVVQFLIGEDTKTVKTPVLIEKDGFTGIVQQMYSVR